MATSGGLPPGWRMDWDHSVSRCFFVFEASGFRQWDFPKAGDELNPQQSGQGDALQISVSLDKESAGDCSPRQDLTSPPSRPTAAVAASGESQANDKPQDEKPPADTRPDASDDCGQKSETSMPSEAGATTTPLPQPMFVIPASELAKYIPNALPTSGETPQFYVLQSPPGGVLQPMLGTQPPPYSATSEATQDTQTDAKAATEAPISADVKEKAVEDRESADHARDPLSKQESNKLTTEDTRSSIDTATDGDRCSLTSTQSPPISEEQEEVIPTKSHKLSKWSTKTLKKTVNRTGSLVMSTANKTMSTANKTMSTANKTMSIARSKTMPVMASTATKTKSAFASAASKTVPVVASTASKTGGIMASAAKKTGTIVASTAKESGKVMKGALNSPAATFVASAVGDAVIEAAGKHFGVAGASKLVNHSLSKLEEVANELAEVSEAIEAIQKNEEQENEEQENEEQENEEQQGAEQTSEEQASEEQTSEAQENIESQNDMATSQQATPFVSTIVQSPTVQPVQTTPLPAAVPQVPAELPQGIVVLPQQSDSQMQPSSTATDPQATPTESSESAADDSLAAQASSPNDQGSEPTPAPTNLQQLDTQQLQASDQTGGLSLPSDLQQQLQAGAVLPSNLQQQLQAGAVFPANLQQQLQAGAVFPANLQQQLQAGAVFPSALQQQLQAGAVFPSNLQQQLQAGAVFPSNLQQQLQVQLLLQQQQQLALQQQQQQLTLQQQQQLASQQLQMLMPGTPPGETGSYFVAQPGTQIGHQQQMSLNTQLAVVPNVAGPAAAPTPPASPPEAKAAPGSPPKEVPGAPPKKASRFLKSLAVNVAVAAIPGTSGGGSVVSELGDAISSLIS